MEEHSATQGEGQAMIQQETVIAKDEQSLFENLKDTQTAADSATVKGDLRQSLGGNMVD